MALKISYTNELLQNFCKENNIIIKNDITEHVNCNTKIISKCFNDNCNNNYEKKFYILFKTKNFFCKKCSIQNGTIKNKKNMQEKYGVDCIFKLKQIKQKIKETNIEKYGVDNPSKHEEFKNKMLKTKIEKYNIKPKIILTEEEKNKQLIEKYGTINFRNSEIIKNKIKDTCIKKYGKEHISQVDSIQKIKKENNIKKYGCEWHMQVPEIAEKVCKNALKSKIYKFPSGKTIKVQGYEPFALKNLIENEQIDENNIVVGCKNVPKIWYIDKKGKKRRHYVDIYIPSQNKCIEVKSIWTVKKENVFIKKQAAEELGYLYEILVYNDKGILLNKF
jgi:hypothetical protein